MSTVEVGEDPYAKKMATFAGLDVIENPNVPKGEVWFLSSVDGTVSMKLKGLLEEPKNGESD